MSRPESDATQSKPTFLRYIHHFRAFAIINIMVIHVWFVPKEYADWAGTAVVDTFREVAFHSSTIYFVFISGFLLHHLSNHFTLKQYYLSKIKHVISPYIAWSVAILAVDSVRNNLDKPFWEVLTPCLLLGRADVQYWYIPFMALAFLVSPFILRIPKRVFGWTVLVASLLPLLGTRTGTQLSPWQYVYFFPIYLLGAYFAMNIDKCVNAMEEFSLLIVFTLVASTVGLFLLDAGTRFSVIRPYESLQYLNKMSATFIAISLFRKLETRRLAFLDLFADYSFALYFSHTYIAWHLMNRFYRLLMPVFSQNLILVSVLFAVAMIFASLGSMVVMKTILGRYSRQLIGA